MRRLCTVLSIRAFWQTQAFAKFKPRKHKNMTRYSPVAKIPSACRLRASSTRSSRGYANLRLLRKPFSYRPSPRPKEKGSQRDPFSFGRGDKIRTCDFYVPNVALYQAEPHLVMNLFFGQIRTCAFYVPNRRASRGFAHTKQVLTSFADPYIIAFFFRFVNLFFKSFLKLFSQKDLLPAML